MFFVSAQVDQVHFNQLKYLKVDQSYNYIVKKLANLKVVKIIVNN